MKKVLLILVATVFSFSSAMADVMVTVGYSANKSVFGVEGKERNYDYAGTLEKTTVEYGAFEDSYHSIFAEVGNGIVGFGISYVPSSISTPTLENTQVQITNATSTSETWQADFDSLMTVYGIARLPKFGLYVKAGVSTMDIDITETNASAVYKDHSDVDGLTVGFGIEKDAADTGFAVRAELMVHEFDDVSGNNGSGVGVADANVFNVTEMMGATATISLVKNF